MPRDKYKYFDMPTLGDAPSPHLWKRPLKSMVSKFIYPRRAKEYHRLAAGAQVVNFQQTLNAYGSTSLFHWLNKPSETARVVTVHELDKSQLANPHLNKAYNNADAVIVQQGPLRDKLVGLGVDPRKIELVLHGTHVPPVNDNQHRDGIIIYCGHHPFSNKGLQGIFDAVALLKARLGAAAPRLKVHGYVSREDHVAMKAMAAQLGLENQIDWLNQVPMRDAFVSYQSSQLCVLPYSGSFAGLAAAAAAAAGIPVIGTRTAGIPEHLGENVVWLKGDNAHDIAAQVEKLLASAELWQDLSARLRRHAEQHLTWDIVAGSTLAVYQRALKNKAMQRGELQKSAGT
jgi:glycosyltransferase involved in cell wall biosynthesis